MPTELTVNAVALFIPMLLPRPVNTKTLSSLSWSVSTGFAALSLLTLSLNKQLSSHMRSLKVPIMLLVPDAVAAPLLMPFSSNTW